MAENSKQVAKAGRKTSVSKRSATEKENNSQQAAKSTEPQEEAAVLNKILLAQIEEATNKCAEAADLAEKTVAEAVNRMAK